MSHQNTKFEHFLKNLLETANHTKAILQDLDLNQIGNANDEEYQQYLATLDASGDPILLLSGAKPSQPLQQQYQRKRNHGLFYASWTTILRSLRDITRGFDYLTTHLSQSLSPNPSETALSAVSLVTPMTPEFNPAWSMVVDHINDIQEQADLLEVYIKQVDAGHLPMYHGEHGEHDDAGGSTAANDPTSAGSNGNTTTTPPAPAPAEQQQQHQHQQPHYTPTTASPLHDTPTQRIDDFNSVIAELLKILSYQFIELQSSLRLVRSLRAGVDGGSGGNGTTGPSSSSSSVNPDILNFNTQTATLPPPLLPLVLPVPQEAYKQIKSMETGFLFR